MVLQSLTIDEQTEANQIILLTATNTTVFLQRKIKISFPKRTDFFESFTKKKNIINLNHKSFP